MIEPQGEAISVETSGKVLVLPTGNAAVLPRFNEYTLDPNRLTIAESPFGGLKGSGSPDFAVGTLYTATDGIYLTDTSGTNSTKTLTAGKLKELNLLTVDTQAHSITQEFVVANTATSNNPTVIDNCDSATDWSQESGTVSSITVENGRIKVVGTTDAQGDLRIQRIVSLNLSNYYFILFKLESTLSSKANVVLFQSTNYKKWNNVNFTISANTNSTIVCPILSPQGTTGSMPSIVSGTMNYSSISKIYLGVTATANTSVTFYLDNITADVARPAYVELQVPDNLADTSLTLQCWNGSVYNTTWTAKLDPVYALVYSDSPRSMYLDGTLLGDCYGATVWRNLYPKGIAGQTVTTPTGTMTYSANKGTRNRIGFMVQLPPSDGRTNFSKIRLKTVLYYSDLNKATNILPDLSGNGNNGAMDRVGLVADDKGNPYGAMIFNGSNSSVSCGNPATLNLSNSPFTISMRVNPTDESNRDILKKCDASFYGVALYRQASKFISLYRDVTHNNDITSSVTTTAGNWYHIVITVDGINNNIYVNNTKTSKASGLLTFSNTSLLSIGSTVGIAPYLGKVADVKIYARALTDQEVTALYNNQSVSSTGLVASWNPKTVSHMGATTYEFADSTSASYGLQNVVKPWLSIYNPTDNYLDFYLFTHRPKNLSYKRDESGNIYELTMYPGNGLLYWGRITYPNLTLDSDSNLIPNCLEASVEGSLTIFLQAYGMVIQ
jgi:hypothetical protein